VTFVNHYSYALAASLALLAIGTWALRRRTRGAIAALAIAAVLLAGADVALRPGDPSVRTVAEFDRALASGRPALVEFYSNY